MTPLRRNRLGWGLSAIVALAVPFIGNDYLLTILILAAIYTILTVGLNFFMGYTGQVSFGHNAFAAIGGYGSAILTTRYGLAPVPALVIAAALAAAAAVVVGYPTLRLKGHYLAMATLALGLIVYEIAVQATSFTQGYLGISGIPPLGVGRWEAASDPSFYYLAWLLAAAALWLSERVKRSRMGRALEAIAGNEEAARALGIDVAGMKLRAFVISAVHAAIAGSLFAHYVGFVSPEVFGLHMVLLLFTMLFVGGIGTVYGPLWGALVISLLPEVLRDFKDYRELVYGGIILIVLLFAPRGLAALAPVPHRREPAR